MAARTPFRFLLHVPFPCRRWWLSIQVGLLCLQQWILTNLNKCTYICVRETGTHNRQCLLCPSNACLSNKPHKCLISIEPLSAGFRLPIWTSPNSEGRTRLDTYLLSSFRKRLFTPHYIWMISQNSSSLLGANSSQQEPHSSISHIAQKHGNSRVPHPAPAVKFFRNIRKRRRGFASSVHRIKSLQGSLLAFPDLSSAFKSKHNFCIHALADALQNLSRLPCTRHWH